MSKLLTNWWFKFNSIATVDEAEFWYQQRSVLKILAKTGEFGCQQFKPMISLFVLVSSLIPSNVSSQGGFCFHKKIL